ncbi:MAG: hypothetical protein ACE5K1_04865 [Acidiferrobacterales bacterium]
MPIAQFCDALRSNLLALIFSTAAKPLTPIYLLRLPVDRVNAAILGTPQPYAPIGSFRMPYAGFVIESIHFPDHFADGKGYQKTDYEPRKKERADLLHVDVTCASVLGYQPNMVSCGAGEHRLRVRQILSRRRLFGP